MDTWTILMLQLALGIIGYLLRIWALELLWGWYMVPIFGLPALGTAACLGLILIAGLLTHRWSTSDVNEDGSQQTIRANTVVSLLSIASSGIAIGLGYAAICIWPL